jgi:APA family basic amino acid/polyamine antiporter
LPYPQDGKNTDSSVDEARQLKRVVGLWNSFAMGYADVGADIYVALGIIAAVALNLAPFAFAIAAITYATTGLCYAELASTYPVAGGAQFYSLRAFGPFHGFIAGWGLMLDYTVDIALFAIASTGYFGILEKFVLGTTILEIIPWLGIFSIIIIIALMVLNLIGIKYSANFNLVFVVANLVTMGFVIGIAFAYVGASGKLLSWSMGLGNSGVGIWDFANATSLAMVSYIGIESVSQAAEETRYPARVIPRATKLAIWSVIFLSISLSIISVTVLHASNFVTNMSTQQYPMVAIAQNIPLGPITAALSLWTAFIGFAICYVSTNTGVIGVSRVTFSMGRLKLFPTSFAKLHPRFLTPYVTIIIFPLVACAIIAFNLVVFRGANLLGLIAQLYNFGALIAYMYVNLSLIVLRNTDPRERGWKIPGSFRFKIEKREVEVPIVPVIGFISCFVIWTIIVRLHIEGLVLGSIWFAVGILAYILFRKRSKLPVFHQPPKVGERVVP